MVDAAVLFQRRICQAHNQLLRAENDTEQHPYVHRHKILGFKWPLRQYGAIDLETFCFERGMLRVDTVTVLDASYGTLYSTARFDLELGGVARRHQSILLGGDPESHSLAFLVFQILQLVTHRPMA